VQYILNIGALRKIFLETSIAPFLKTHGDDHLLRASVEDTNILLDYIIIWLKNLSCSCSLKAIDTWRIMMQSVTVFCDSIEVDLRTGPDICDITPELERLIQSSNVEDGCLCATTIGSTGSITAIELEPGVVEDLKRAIDRLAPPGLDYEPEKAWHDGNGHSHVQAALLGPSITLPIRSGRLKLGTWQQIVAVNHDNRARSRHIEVTIIGR
jgi:secondary thiamine-phosphate synthase enzyme